MISRYDPLRDALSLRRAMDQLFDQSFVNPGTFAGPTATIAPMDVCETPNGYEVDVALPGARPEDVEITVDQNTLTIRGRYSYQNEHQNQVEGQSWSQQQGQQGQSGQAWSQQQGQTGQQSWSQQQGQTGQTQAQQQGQRQQQGTMERHKQGHNWLLKEIPSGTFERTITFPRPIDINNIQTKFENGILTIMLPVSEASRPKRISLTGGQQQPQQIPVEAGQQRVEAGQQRQPPR